MRTTIDKAGRAVTPAPIDESAGLTPASELDIVEDNAGVRLGNTVARPLRRIMRS